ncbi:DNA glycosylase [Xylaria sp. CBS 124048]|nr:DNA glycosylase [Xylaria sp. CBS 124048]
MRRSLRNVERRARPTYVEEISEFDLAEDKPTNECKPARQPQRTVTTSKSKSKTGRKRKEPGNASSRVDNDDNYQESIKEQEYEEETKKNKKRRIVQPTRKLKNGNNHESHIYQRLFASESLSSDRDKRPSDLPARVHSIEYHRPLLLSDRHGRTSLLEWFDGVSSARSMPWRKPWINPRDDLALLRQKLERRAYEVWISEIMLQQTRVAVVIDYWNRWMEKWPTIHELAAAEPDEVLAAWRGLGYYSRATRIHDAAKLVCGDPVMEGLLPSSVDELVAKVPGVGRYTAGAISAIVFGKASPMVDGNVLRVLSRQLAILGDVKTDKLVNDLLWAAADSLVKAIAKDSSDDEAPGVQEEDVSDRPGRWGQALMELGSTICTPKPDCEACPISGTCRAYAEGLMLASTKGQAPKQTYGNIRPDSPTDIEDSCNICRPFEEVTDGEDIEARPLSKKKGKAKKRIQRQASLSAYFPHSSDSEDEAKSTPKEITPAAFATIVDHARKFPVRAIKKAVKEQETLVCAIRRSDGRYLIHRRPQKGLLAGLWEFPSRIVPEDHKTTAAAYTKAAELYASEVLDSSLKARSSTHPRRLKLVRKLGSVPWLFSHLKLTMHVFLFALQDAGDEVDAASSADRRWSDAVEDESMGTGMRKCWDLVREANGD